MKQVAVRMPEPLRRAAVKMAKREKMSFGRFVRQAVDSHIETLKQWRPTGDDGWMSSKNSEVL